MIAAPSTPLARVLVLRPGLDFRRSPLLWEVVPLEFDSMFDGHEAPLQGRGWELHVVPLFTEIILRLDVIEE